MKNCKLNLTKKSCTLGSVEVQVETEMSNYYNNNNNNIAFFPKQVGVG